MIKSAPTAEITSHSESMMLRSDVDVAADGPAVLPGSGGKQPSSSAYRLCLAFLLFSTAVIGLQVLSGTYRSEFSAYPDEPAHYVTSLMVWDYVRHIHFVSPLRFAQNYYAHYPKVALGHWPPFFYFIQAAWMLVFSPARAAVRIEIALTTALLALAVYSEVRKRFGGRSGVIAGLLCTALPLVQTASDEEMAEAMLTLCCFWSVIFFARFIGSARRRDALLFALFFSLAVLTKGNGWLLAMVPVLSLLLTRKLSLVRGGAVWFAVVVVAATCLPWQLLTMKMAERGWEGGSHPSARYSVEALWQFLLLFPAILGPILVLVMLVGTYRVIVRPLFTSRVDALDACMFALLLSVWIFHSIVPAGVEDRKLIIAVPAMIYFIVPGAKELSRLLPAVKGNLGWRLPAVTAALTLCFFLQTFSVPKIEHYGFDRVAGFIAARPQLENNNILVSSQSVGEGLLVSELAMLHPEPVATIIRATKSLATVEWNGAGYQCRYRSIEEIVQYLKTNHVGVVVIDTFPKIVDFRHDQLLRKALQNSSVFELISRFDSPSHVPGNVSIYRVRL